MMTHLAELLLVLGHLLQHLGQIPHRGLTTTDVNHSFKQ